MTDLLHQTFKLQLEIMDLQYMLTRKEIPQDELMMCFLLSSGMLMAHTVEMNSLIASETSYSDKDAFYIKNVNQLIERMEDTKVVLNKWLEKDSKSNEPTKEKGKDGTGQRNKEAKGNN